MAPASTACAVPAAAATRRPGVQCLTSQPGRNDSSLRFDVLLPWVRGACLVQHVPQGSLLERQGHANHNLQQQHTTL